MAVNKISDYISGIHVTSESGELKSTLFENTHKCKTALKEIEEKNNLLKLNLHPADKFTEDERSILDRAINEANENMRILNLKLHELHGHVEYLGHRVRNKRKRESTFDHDMIVKTAVTSSALKVLSTLFGIRIQIKLKPNLNTYQIKLYGDGFDITLAMDKDKEEKFQLLDITPKPKNFNGIKALLSETNDVCGLVVNCRKYK